MGLMDEALKSQIIQLDPGSLQEALNVAQTNEISKEVAGPSSAYLSQVVPVEESSINRFQGCSFRGRNRQPRGFVHFREFGQSRGFSQSREFGRFRGSQPRAPGKECHRCGEPISSHRGECPATNWQCFDCHEIQN